MPDSLWTRNFLYLWFSQIIMCSAFFGVMTIIPVFLVSEMGLEGILMGAVTALYVASAVTSRAVTGHFLDRYGRMVVYLPAFVLMGVLFFFYPLVGGIAGIAFLRIVQGAAWGALQGAATTLAVDIVPAARRGEGIGLYGLTFNLGQAIGPAIGVALAAWLGYNGLFVAAGLVALLGFLLVLKIRPPAVSLRQSAFSWRNLLEKSSLPTSCVLFFMTVPFGVMLNYTILYCSQELPDATPGTMFLLMAAGMALARLAAGKAFDRSGPAKAMTWSYILIVGGLCLKMFTRDATAFYAFGLLMGIGCGIATPVCQSMVNMLAPAQRRGAANATCMTAFDSGICLGLLAIGYTQHALGWEVSHVMELVSVGVSMALFWFFALPHYRRFPHPGAGEEAKTTEKEPGGR